MQTLLVSFSPLPKHIQEPAHAHMDRLEDRQTGRQTLTDRHADSDIQTGSRWQTDTLTDSGRQAGRQTDSYILWSAVLLVTYLHIKHTCTCPVKKHGNTQTHTEMLNIIGRLVSFHFLDCCQLLYWIVINGTQEGERGWEAVYWQECVDEPQQSKEEKNAAEWYSCISCKIEESNYCNCKAFSWPLKPTVWPSTQDLLQKKTTSKMTCF